MNPETIGTSRRTFLRQVAGAFVGAPLGSAVAWGAETAPRRMRTCLTPGSIGVSADQLQAVELAHRFGFEAVEPYGSWLAGLSQSALDQLLGDLKAKGLAWGAAGLPVEFRQDAAKFDQGMSGLDKIAAGLQRAGVTRVGTWLMPSHGSLTYLENFRQHVERLGKTAAVLKDHGLRLGLEYVGTPTVLTSRKYPFVHTLAETRELMDAIGTGNMGVVLDSWHWCMAGDTEEDLLRLRATDVISVDLNDAPAGVPKERQVDGRRELPCATGVIDLAAFLNALNRLGYDGPVRAEPFNKALNDLGNEEACAAVARAMKQAMALIGHG